MSLSSSPWVNYLGGLASKKTDQCFFRDQWITFDENWFGRHFEPIPSASSLLCSGFVVWLGKIRCHKVESIQSCGFWQELNKIEVDRYDERAKDGTSLLHPPTHHLLLDTLPVSYLSPDAHVQRGAIIETLSHTPSQFQSACSVEVCTCMRHVEA